MADSPGCEMCGQPYHRYGTSDPEHKYDAMGCVNTLRGKVEELEGALTAQRAEDVEWREAVVAEWLRKCEKLEVEVAKWLRMDKLAWSVAGDYWDRNVELETEIERLRAQVNSGRAHPEVQEGLPVGTLPREPVKTG